MLVCILIRQTDRQTDREKRLGASVRGEVDVVVYIRASNYTVKVETICISIMTLFLVLLTCGLMSKSDNSDRAWRRCPVQQC
jgi:hypothetical protein